MLGDHLLLPATCSGCVELALSGGSTFAAQEAQSLPMIIGLSVMLASLPWVAYNRWMIAGRTGQSLGKRVDQDQS